MRLAPGRLERLLWGLTQVRQQRSGSRFFRGVIVWEGAILLGVVVRAGV